jgi:hypothetical protein
MIYKDSSAPNAIYDKKSKKYNYTIWNIWYCFFFFLSRAGEETFFQERTKSDPSRPYAAAAALPAAVFHATLLRLPGRDASIGKRCHSSPVLRTFSLPMKLRYLILSSLAFPGCIWQPLPRQLIQEQRSTTSVLWHEKYGCDHISSFFISSFLRNC